MRECEEVDTARVLKISKIEQKKPVNNLQNMDYDSPPFIGLECVFEVVVFSQIASAVDNHLKGQPLIPILDTLYVYVCTFVDTHERATTDYKPPTLGVATLRSNMRVYKDWKGHIEHDAFGQYSGVGEHKPWRCRPCRGSPRGPHGTARASGSYGCEDGVTCCSLCMTHCGRQAGG